MSTYPGYSVDGPRISDDALREAAVKRLKARREFQAHLLAYILVNGFLVVIWAMTGAAFFWPIFPILGWGIGLAFNAWNVYSPEPTAKQIETEMERLRRSER
ncbi:MAG: 2TM domain-containing protein [Actinomycetes bacterium]